MTRKLTEILTAKDHQRIIDRYTRMLKGDNSPAHILPTDLLRKIEWHTNEYLSKTGQLPE